jgi:hypothetical protein
MFAVKSFLDIICAPRIASTGLNDQMADRLKIETKSVLLDQDTLMDFVPANMKDRMLFKLVYDPKILSKFQGVSNSGWKKKSA